MNRNWSWKFSKIALSLWFATACATEQQASLAASDDVQPPKASSPGSVATKDKDPKEKVPKEKDAKDKSDAKTEQLFTRTVKDARGKPIILQTAVVTYKADTGPYSKASVDLIGAIHIADKPYYQILNKKFQTYDALLYEMVADPHMVKEVVPGAQNRSAVSAVQGGLKDLLGLSFQLDEIDYQAKNFVHADMNPEQFTKSLAERQEGMLQFILRSMGSSLAMQGAGKSNDLDVLGALFSGNRELAMKRVLATQMEQMDGQMAAIAGDDGRSTLITERNAKALEVLKKELDGGKKRLGIFYGAGHFRHMSEQLEKDFHMHPVKTEWLDAWSMR